MDSVGRLGAVFAALILITAPIVPFTPIDTVDAAGNSATETPRELKADAVSQVEQLNASKRQYISARERARGRLNESRQYYRGQIRATDGSLFTHDAVAVQALAKFARTDETADAIDAADTVVRADNRTAHRELADARRLLDEWGSKLDSKGARRSLEAHLRNAERAFDRATRTISDARAADGRRALRLHASSIRRLRLTWRQAHHVVERIVQRTNATLPITNETGPDEPGATFDGNLSLSVLGSADPISNQSGESKRTFKVGITSDGQALLGEVTTTVDGDRVQTRNLSGLVVTQNRTVPVSVTIPLSEGGHRVEFTVTGNDGETTANSVVLVDGDGLNATYENETLGTDPLDPDSDASQTSANEAGNGTLDGREDFDGDGLTTLQELELGTDPLVADTDEDGLRDGTEEFVLPTSPLDPDSDGDGTLDGAGDRDGDGLSTAEELDAGTVPWIADTDHDGLSDAAELDRGLDPRDPDSDDDFLSDGVEGTGPFDTEPTNPDTDGDGTVDGNETYTSTVRNESLGASVEITGEGNVAGQTTIEAAEHVRYSEPYVPNASVAPVVSFETTANFSTATLSIEYNESRLSDDASEQNLSIYRFNETLGRWEPVNSTVDTSADVVTAQTPHFSDYTVFENSAWIEYLQNQRNFATLRHYDRYENRTFESPPSSINESEWTCDVRSDEDSGPNEELEGSCGFRNGTVYVREESRDQRFLNTSLSLPDENRLLLKTKVTALNPTYYTETGLVIHSESTSDTVLPFARSDEVDSGTFQRRVNLTKYAGENVTVTAVVNGGGCYTSEYRYNASTASNDHRSVKSPNPCGDYRSPDSASLAIHYLDIEAPTNTTLSMDTDGDGISDYREVTGIPLANGRVVTLDPENSDTDGDGIPDGEEVNVSSRVTQELSGGSEILGGFRWTSDPTARDTDGDLLSDSLEETGWTVQTINRSGSAYRWASVSSNSNGTIHVSSNPLDPDSDDDGLDDEAEKWQAHTDPNGDITYGIAVSTDTYPGVWDIGELRTDRDQDGISDYLETEYGFIIHTPTTGWDRLYTDPDSPDTDGDSLHESVEYGSVQSDFLEFDREIDAQGTDYILSQFRISSVIPIGRIPMVIG